MNDWEVGTAELPFTPRGVLGHVLLWLSRYFGFLEPLAWRVALRGLFPNADIKWERRSL